MESIKQQWKDFKHDQPGKRCQNLYERRHQEDASKTSRFVALGLGLILTALGVILIPAPGPGSMVTFLGLALLASEFQPMARFLDAFEVKARAAKDWVMGLWSHASLGFKTVAVVTLALLALSVGYGAFRFFFSDEPQPDKQVATLSLSSSG